MSNPNVLTAPQQDDEQLALEREQAYENFLSLQEQDLPLDGPTLTKAGLSYERRMELGYDGSMDQFVEDANTWKAAREAEEAREAKQAEADRHAADWHKETAELRERREAGKNRIDALMDGTAATEGMSYKEKLQAGGEIGARKQAERSRMSREEALATAEAEGHEVGHLKPRTHEVTRDTAAEARAKEMAQLLSEQGFGGKRPATDAEMADEHSQLVKPEGVPDWMWDGDNEQKQEFLQHWNELSEEDRAQQIEDWKAAEVNPDFKKRTAEMDKETRDKYFENVEAAREARELQAEEPADDLSAKGLRARVKRIFDKGSKKLTQIYATAGNFMANPMGTRELTNEMSMTDNEVRERARRATIVLGVGIGALAVAKLYATMNGLHHGSGSGAEALAGRMPGHEIVDTAAPHAPKFETFTLHSGESPWGQMANIAAEHGTKISDEHMTQLANTVLHHNHIKWDQVHNLAVGTKYEIPREVLAELEKGSR